MSIHQFTQSDLASSAQSCAKHILAVLDQALAGHDVATFAVSGGSSPRQVFQALAEARFDWSRVHLFWVDERCVPPYHEHSNFRMVDESFIIPSGFPRRQAHRVYAELMPRRAAERYAEDIREAFGIHEGQVPKFDLIHLGMGPDGHTASLFPGDPLIEDRENITAATYVEKMRQNRVTLMPLVLLAAHHIVFFAPGADKADTTRAVFDDPFDPMRLPAQLPAHLGRSVAWFLDVGAAAGLVGAAR
jgi:6-phosphogluconolactonase